MVTGIQSETYNSEVTYLLISIYLLILDYKCSEEYISGKELTDRKFTLVGRYFKSVIVLFIYSSFL